VADGTETVMNMTLENETDPARKLQLKIASRIDDVFSQISNINSRLEKGDVIMQSIQDSIDNLPCQKPASECTAEPAKIKKWTQSPAIWGTGAASFLIGIIEVFKHYFSTK